MSFIRIFCACYLFLVIFSVQAKSEPASDTWLKNKFSQQHQALLPKVTVANMFWACNKERKTDPVNYQIKDLVNNMPKATLSEKLQACLATDSVKSEQAINFALLGCFSQQFAGLTTQEYQANMSSVHTLLQRLPVIEKQKSLTKCVTMQAIDYLQ